MCISRVVTASHLCTGWRILLFQTNDMSTRPTARRVPYAEKLRDVRWQKKRLAVLNAAGWMCQLCGDEKREMHVHHPKYIRGREPWEYTNLICLCAKCHGERHGVAAPYRDPLWAIVLHDAKAGNADARAVLSLRRNDGAGGFRD